MVDPEAGPPVVALPQPVDRRLRLGPFASAHDAVKFAGYAATGAVLAPFLTPYAWLPVLAVGFLVSAWRPEGEALDERAARWATWRVRHLLGGRVVSSPRPPPARGNFLRLGPGRYVTVLRTGGTPLAYRPPVELERVFRAYGDLLRASEGVILLHAGVAPLSADPLTPTGTSPGRPDELAAWEGYRELVSVLCRRRLVRRVDLALSNAESCRDAPARLDQATRGAERRLIAVGLRVARLGTRALSEAGHRFGWTFGGGRE